MVDKPAPDVNVVAVTKPKPPPLNETEREVAMLQALRLRENGVSYRAIAEQLKIGERKLSVGAIYALVQDAIAEMHEQVQETVERIKLLEYARLDAMWLDLSYKADGTKIDQSPRVVDSKLRIMERRARMMGTDAALQITGPGGGPLQFQNTDPRDQVRAKVEAIRVRIAGGASLGEAIEVMVEMASVEATGPAPQNGAQNGTPTPTNGDAPHA